MSISPCGHKDVYTRKDGSVGCRTCAKRKENRDCRTLSLRFDPDPLFDLYRPLKGKQGKGYEPSWDEVADSLGVTTRTVHRWKKEGIGERMADKLAVGIGLHPSLIWPEWTDEKSSFE